MLSQKELEAMMAAEAKHLGVGNKEFILRHNEIIGQIYNLRGKGVAANGKADYERQGRYDSAGGV